MIGSSRAAGGWPGQLAGLARPGQIRLAVVAGGRRGGPGGGSPAAAQDRRNQPARRGQPGGHGWPGRRPLGDRPRALAAGHTPAPPVMGGQQLGAGQSAVHRPGWCMGRYPGWCAGHWQGAGTAHCRGWCAGHCPGATWDRRDLAVSRARPPARTGLNRGRSGWANRPAWHRVTGPPAAIPGAHLGRTLARNPRRGSSRFLARSRPAAAAPVPPVAWARNPPAASARNPPAASAGNGAAWVRSRIQRARDHAAYRPAPARASGPGQRSASAAGRVLQFADRAGCQLVGLATGQRSDPDGLAWDRLRSGRVGRAVPATHLSVARSRPAGRSADCHTSAVDHPARRRPDRYGCASVPAGGRLPDHVLPAGHPRGAGAAVDHPAVRRPGTAVGRSTAHPAVPRPATAADLARNRSGRAAPAPDPDADWRRGHAADASRVGASLRSACCALSPGQREITTSCGTQAFPRRHSSPPAAIGQPSRPGQVLAWSSQRAGR